MILYVIAKSKVLIILGLWVLTSRGTKSRGDHHSAVCFGASCVTAANSSASSSSLKSSTGIHFQQGIQQSANDPSWPDEQLDQRKVNALERSAWQVNAALAPLAFLEIVHALVKSNHFPHFTLDLVSHAQMPQSN